MGDTCTCFAHSWSVFNPELELLRRVFLRQFFEMTRTRPRVLRVSFDEVRRTEAEQLKFLNRQVQPRHGTGTVGSRSPLGSRRACVTKESSMSRASRTDPPRHPFIPQNEKRSKCSSNTTTWQPKRGPYPLILRVVHPPRERNALFFTTLQKKKEKRKPQLAARGASLQEGDRKKNVPSSNSFTQMSPPPQAPPYADKERKQYPVVVRQSLSLNSQLV